MIGLPRDLFTKADWLNAVEYARVNGNSRRVMISRLEALKENTTMLIPKKTGVAKLSDGDTSGEDELPEEDFEVVYDPNRAYLIFCVNAQVPSERNPFLSKLNGELV